MVIKDNGDGPLIEEITDGDDSNGVSGDTAAASVDAKNVKKRKSKKVKDESATPAATMKQVIQDKSWLSKLNWSAVAILLMMTMPMIIMGVVYVYDIMYPQDAMVVAIRQRMVACYTVANPSKLTEIDSLLSKNKKKEIKLLIGLSKKYGSEYDECVYRL